MHHAAEASPSLFQWSLGVSTLAYLNVSVTWTWKWGGHSNRVVASVKPTLMPLCSCMCGKIKENMPLVSCFRKCEGASVFASDGRLWPRLSSAALLVCAQCRCHVICMLSHQAKMPTWILRERRPLRERTGLCLDGVIMAIGVPAWALYIRTCRYKKQWEFYIFGAGSACVCLAILFTCGNERRRKKKKNSICIPETVSTLSSVICVGN